jgi:UDP-N-acetylglucosamine 2-epimerase
MSEVFWNELGIPLIHVEAGLHSFNKKMPEEVNRIMTDHVSDLLFCSPDVGVNQLAKEGITEGVYNVGDVMYDSVQIFSKKAEQSLKLSDIIPYGRNDYYLATIHRPSYTDSEENLVQILNSFGRMDKPVVWPVHPRNNARLKRLTIPANLHLIEPQPYIAMLYLIENSSKVLTDSGGLQKEAYWLKKQCIT